MARFVALLRGINVGGNNIIKMADLKACFESMGFRNVSTYIQSGNVIFESGLRSPAKIAATCEETLSKTFSYNARVVIRSAEQIRATIANAPASWSVPDPSKRRNFVFLREPITAADAMEALQIKKGIKEVVSGEEVLYWTSGPATQVIFAKLAGMKIYKDMTIRNYNTTLKLSQLLAATGG